MNKIADYTKKIVLLLLVLCFFAALGGCDTRTQETGELPDGYQPEIGGKITVTCANAAHGTEETRKSIRSWFNAFTSKYSNVDIEVEFVDEGQMMVLASARSLGDVFWMSDGHLSLYAGTHEALMPLDYYIELYDIDLSNIYNGIYNLSLFNGKYYFVGMSCGNVTFSYNVDDMYEAGILEPGERIANDWTWEDFKNICTQLKSYDKDGVTLTNVGATFNLAWSNMFSPFLYAYGGDAWYDTVNKKINLFSEGVQKGISELIYCIDNRLIYPYTTSMSSEMAKEYSKITTQNTTFRFNDSYTILSSKVSDWVTQGVEWDVAPWPLFDYAASPCGSLGFGVFSYTNNKDAAAALALFLLTDEGQIAYHGQAGGDVPCLKTVANGDFWHLDTPGYTEINNEAFVANYEKYIPGQVNQVVPPDIATAIQNGIAALFNNYCTGKKSWEDSLRELETKCNEIWETLNWQVD